MASLAERLCPSAELPSAGHGLPTCVFLLGLQELLEAKARRLWPPHEIP